MNDIQVEVNFFEWFDRNYKPKVLNRTTKKSLQSENKVTHREPKSMTTNHTNQQMVANNIYLAKKTPLENQHGQINTINKNNTNATHKDKKKSPTKDSKKNVTKQNNKKPICHKCKKIGHHQNNCISDKNCRSQLFKSNSKLKTPDLHLEINALK